MEEIYFGYEHLFVGDNHNHNEVDIFIVRAHAVFSIIGLFSILGNISVVIANCLWLPEKTGSRRLVLGIAVSEIIATSCYLWGFILTEQDVIYHHFNSTCDPLPTFQPTQSCIIQAFIMNIFALSSFMHHAFLSCLIVSVVYTCRVEYIDSIIRISRIFPWIVATLFPVLAAWHGVFGFSPCSTAGWCWLGNVPHQHRWALTTGRFWEILTQIIIYSCYGASIAKVILQKARSSNSLPSRVMFSCSDKRCSNSLQFEDQESSVNVEYAKKFIRKLVLLPLCFSLCYLPGFIRYEVMLPSIVKKGNFMREDTIDKIFYFLHGAGNCMTGIPNFFIFVLSNQHVKENAQVAYSNYCNIIRQRKVRYHKTTLILTSRRSDSTCEGREHFTESSLLLPSSTQPSSSRMSDTFCLRDDHYFQLDQKESDIGFLS